MLPRVAYVTDAGHGDPELSLAIAAFERTGLEAVPVRWDSGSQWGDFDLAIVRRTDAAERRQDFLRWARQVEDETLLANPGVVLARNTDRSQIRDFARMGVPTVESVWMEPGDSAEDFGAQVRERGWLRMKVLPNVREPRRRAVVVESVERAEQVASELVSRGWMALAQSDAFENTRSATLVVMDGRVAACLDADRADIELDQDLVNLADRVLELAGGAEHIVQARLDVVGGPGDWRLQDFDATEPDLEFTTHQKGADELAWAVRRRVTPDARHSFE